MLIKCTVDLLYIDKLFALNERCELETILSTSELVSHSQTLYLTTMRDYVSKLPTSLVRLGKAFIVAQTSHFNTLFRAGVTGVSVKHRHVSMSWKKLLMVLA